MVWLCKGNYIMILINHNKADLFLTQKRTSVSDSSVKLYFLSFPSYVRSGYPYALYAVVQLQKISV